MSSNENSLTIDVNITNLVLTPLTCASLVNKVIKCLIYEKSQIPYPYEWLRTIVNKKRKNGDNDNSENVNYLAERHFRTVSNAYDTTESLSTQIQNLFKSGSVVEEILLLFGGSEMSPKEVYGIRIPKLPKNHLERNHVQMTNKLSHTVLRQIFLSQTWMNAVDTTLPTTNMFVFLKSNMISNFDNFQPNSSFYITKRTTVIDINFIYDKNDQINCDCNFSVFQEDLDEHNKVVEHKKDATDVSESEEDSESDKVVNDCEWYQADFILKGFKEEFANKTPLSQLW